MKTGNETGDHPLLPSETSATAHQLSGTLDWSSLWARIKNQVVLIPAVTFQTDEQSGDDIAH